MALTGKADLARTAGSDPPAGDRHAHSQPSRRRDNPPPSDDHGRGAGGHSRHRFARPTAARTNRLCAPPGARWNRHLRPIPGHRPRLRAPGGGGFRAPFSVFFPNRMRLNLDRLMRVSSSVCSSHNRVFSNGTSRFCSATSKLPCSALRISCSTSVSSSSIGFGSFIGTDARGNGAPADRPTPT